MTRFLSFWPLALITTFLVIGGIVAYWFVFRPSAVTEDELLRRMYADIALVHSYRQLVETEVELSDRRMRVVGDYRIEGAPGRFSSIATTTLSIPGQKALSFTLQNVSMSEDVYVRLYTDNEELRNAIPYMPAWQHFPRGSIPEPLADIAIAGPILDNLLLFGREGAYVSLRDIMGEHAWNDEALMRYRFALSEEAFEHSGGTLETLIDRLGQSGVVDIWIDPGTAHLRHMVFSGDGYLSTTTITDINAVTRIDPPLIEQ